MLKKSAFVAAAAAGLMMIGSPAFAGGEIDKDKEQNHTGQIGLVNVNDVLNDNNVGVCDNHVNVLGVQVADALNGLGVPLLSPAAETEAAANDICVAESED
ncbi:hypothetical protein [Prauserella sp. PE36]|uniref:hypothetical protein n=1 Tax=Prauserella sp. PE36 TaxID=1504709 RepID=UPI0018F6FD31|nr:hypothetical protein [Prauserella sp. PE36]